MQKNDDAIRSVKKKVAKLNSKFVPSLKSYTFEILDKMQTDRIVEGSAALAFYLTLATFPILISLIAILPYLPIDGLEPLISNLILENMPGNAGALIIDITNQVLSVKRPKLISTGFIVALWAASSGMLAIINQLNVVFDVKERRSFTKRRLISMHLTLIYVFMFIIVSMTLIIGKKFNSLFLNFLGMDEYSHLTFAILKYILGYFLLLLTFSSIYYLAPNHKRKFKLLSMGSMFGANVILVAALIFNYYISYFATYNQIYGSLGGIVIYMLWLYITGYVLLIGAEINQMTYKK